LPLMSKSEVAEKVLEHVAENLYAGAIN